MFQKLWECTPEGSSPHNLVVCPFSVAHSLALLWNCAADNCSDELAKVLGFKGRLSKETVTKLFSDYHDDFLECDTMKMCHKVLVNGQKATTVAVRDDASAKKMLSDFSAETEAAPASKCLKLSDYVEMVNKWAAEQKQSEDEKKVPLNNSIINLVKEDYDSVRPWVLLDLFHFNSPWAIQFPTENTTEQRFWTNETSSVDVQMMHMRETCRYGYMLDLEAAVLELDFDFEDFSMLFLVPDSRTGLQDVLKKLQGTNVMYLAAQLRRQDTLVFVPKFSVDVTFALTQELLGKFVSEPDVSASPFSQSADRLNGLFKAAGAGESKAEALILHKAVIAVGDKGTDEDKQKIGECVLCFLLKLRSKFVKFLWQFYRRRSSTGKVHVGQAVRLPAQVQV